MIIRHDVPITGTASDVSGTCSATMIRNRENDTRIETPSDTFSPLSAGSRKIIKRTNDSMMHGSKMYMK